ncbi:MAG TPA: cytochrome c [Prolixibacteraceae bacterium]|nr:cytochrome c [Prolixibacteraceae bacterium]
MKTNILSLIIITLFIAACSGSNQQKQETQNEPELSESAEAEIENKIVHPGKEVYDAVCLACHMADGSGVPGMHPPLIETEWVSGDKERLIDLVLNGMSGKIKVDGETYNSIMPAHSHLSDQQIANVLSYIRTSFGNNSSPISKEEVAKVRNSAK